MRYERGYLDRLNDIKNGFTIIGIIGARQVGKTTFLREQFPDHEYFNLESPEIFSRVEENLGGFLRENSHIIIDFKKFFGMNKILVGYNKI